MEKLKFITDEIYEIIKDNKKSFLRISIIIILISFYISSLFLFINFFDNIAYNSKYYMNDNSVYVNNTEEINYTSSKIYETVSIKMYRTSRAKELYIHSVDTLDTAKELGEFKFYNDRTDGIILNYNFIKYELGFDNPKDAIGTKYKFFIRDFSDDTYEYEICNYFIDEHSFFAIKNHEYIIYKPFTTAFVFQENPDLEIFSYSKIFRTDDVEGLYTEILNNNNFYDVYTKEYIINDINTDINEYTKPIILCLNLSLIFAFILYLYTLCVDYSFLTIDLNRRKILGANKKLLYLEKVLYHFVVCLFSTILLFPILGVAYILFNSFVIKGSRFFSYGNMTLYMLASIGIILLISFIWDTVSSISHI